MKKLSGLLFYLISLTLTAGQAVVIVWEAPLFYRPSMNSKILQTFRKGEKIFIHDRYFAKSPFETNYDIKPQYNPFDEDEFLETLDRNGNTAWIPKKFVKLITMDTREFNTPISFSGIDPTDYRLEEPLPDDFPFIAAKKLRAGAFLSMGHSLDQSYPYKSRITQRSPESRKGLGFYYGKKMEFDLTDRFYFGGLFRMDFANNKLFLENDGDALEKQLHLAIGPFISYDFYRSENWKWSQVGAAQIQFSRYDIHYHGQFESDRRVFSTVQILPLASTQIYYLDVFPKVDLLFGMNILLNLSHSVEANNKSDVSLWNDGAEDSIHVESGAQFSYFLGLQARY